MDEQMKKRFFELFINDKSKDELGEEIIKLNDDISVLCAFLHELKSGTTIMYINDVITTLKNTNYENNEEVICNAKNAVNKLQNGIYQLSEQFTRIK